MKNTMVIAMEVLAVLVSVAMAVVPTALMVGEQLASGGLINIVFMIEAGLVFSAMAVIGLFFYGMVWMMLPARTEEN